MGETVSVRDRDILARSTVLWDGVIEAERFLFRFVRGLGSSNADGECRLRPSAFISSSATCVAVDGRTGRDIVRNLAGNNLVLWIERNWVIEKSG